MAQQVIDERGWTPASPGAVYDLLADGATWPTWSGVDSFELREPGDAGGESLNAVRVFRTGRVESVSSLSSSSPGVGSATCSCRAFRFATTAPTSTFFPPTGAR